LFLQNDGVVRVLDRQREAAESVRAMWLLCARVGIGHLGAFLLGADGPAAVARLPGRGERLAGAQRASAR
jgi:hypothetical protein